MINSIYLEKNMDDRENLENVKPKKVLSNYFRQPKVYVRLPSDGDFYPNDALDKSVNGDYAVYAMTAKDELMFKTPDALLSGQSTVEVIKSCIPSILDPWNMPSIDLDACLVAIRIATYGDNMEVAVNCPECDAENNYDINLTTWLEQIGQFRFQPEIKFDPLTIHIRPYSYKELTKASIRTFEQQRIFSIINDEKIGDEEKLEKFGESFVKLTELTVDIVAGCIWKVDTPEGSTADKGEIKEFVDNISKDLFDLISKHITFMKEQIELQPQDVVCNECKTKFTMPITMDQSSFFAKGS
jgi:hypothetical protein